MTRSFCLASSAWCLSASLALGIVGALAWPSSRIASVIAFSFGAGVGWIGLLFLASSGVAPEEG